MEETFLGRNTIWYAFYNNFAPFSDFDKIQGFFRRNPSIFCFIREFPLSQSYSTVILPQFGGKDLNDICRYCQERNWQISGIKAFHLSGYFCFHIVNNRAQNIYLNGNKDNQEFSIKYDTRMISIINFFTWSCYWMISIVNSSRDFCPIFSKKGASTLVISNHNTILLTSGNFFPHFHEFLFFYPQFPPPPQFKHIIHWIYTFPRMYRGICGCNWLNAPIYWFNNAWKWGKSE